MPPDGRPCSCRRSAITRWLQAITSHGRARADELETFTDGHSVSVGRFFQQMAKTGFRVGLDAIRAPEIDAGEIDWVTRAMNADGQLDAFDQTLAAFVADERGVTLL